MHSVPPKVPSLWGKLLKDCISKNKSRQLKIFAWGEKRDLITHPACFCSLCLDEFLLLVWFMFLLLLGVFPLAASMSPHWAGLGVLSICWKYADLPVKRGKITSMYGSYSEDAIYEQINQKSIQEYVRCVCWWTNNNIQWLCPLSCPRQMQNVWKILNLRAKEPKFLKSFLYLMKFLLASLIAGSLSAMSVWLLRASSGNNSPSSIISSVTASWGLLAL